MAQLFLQIFVHFCKWKKIPGNNQKAKIKSLKIVITPIQQDLQSDLTTKIYKANEIAQCHKI